MFQPTLVDQHVILSTWCNVVDSTWCFGAWAHALFHFCNIHLLTWLCKSTCVSLLSFLLPPCCPPCCSAHCLHCFSDPLTTSTNCPLSRELTGTNWGVTWNHMRWYQGEINCSNPNTDHFLGLSDAFQLSRIILIVETGLRTHLTPWNSVVCLLSLLTISTISH